MSSTNLAGGLYHYRDLDAKGEGERAALRMQARADEPASRAMFEALVEPRLAGAPLKRILEVGCGSGALARRIAMHSGAEVFATDKSAEMIRFATGIAPFGNVRFAEWDATNNFEFPFGDAPFDLILSSVVVPYLSDDETRTLVRALAARLSPGGLLFFLEQDLRTDSIAFPDADLCTRVLSKDARALRSTMALGLRAPMRETGLALESTRSFLWTEAHYGPYLRDLLPRMAEDALTAKRITDSERRFFCHSLDQMAENGDFHYSLVYHAIVGRRAAVV